MAKEAPARQAPRTQEHHLRRRPCERLVQQHHDHHHRRAGQHDRLVVAGTMGFKGSRKSTPYAAQIAAEDAGRKAAEHGMRTLEVEVTGPGSGRESALRALQAVGFTDHLDPRRDADPAQRLPAAQAPPRLTPHATIRRARQPARRRVRGGPPPPLTCQAPGRAGRDQQELAGPDQAHQARHRGRRRRRAPGDHRRRAAGARLRHDARQCAAPRAAVVAAGRRRHGRADRRRAARVLLDPRRARGRHRHHPQHQGDRAAHALRGPQAHGPAQERPGPVHGRRHRSTVATSRS